MSLMEWPATVGRVNADVGESIKARRLALGMTVKGLAEDARVDRGRLAALEAGDASVRETTIGAVTAALDRREHELGMDTRSIGDPADALIEFTVPLASGVRAVVKGPIRDLAALQAAVAKLVRDMPEHDTPERDD